MRGGGPSGVAGQGNIAMAGGVLGPGINCGSTSSSITQQSSSHGLSSCGKVANSSGGVVGWKQGDRGAVNAKSAGVKASGTAMTC